MQTDKVMDYGATVTGGGLGLDQLYAAVNALLTDGWTGHEVVDLLKGLVLIVFGFVAWRRSHQVLVVKK